MKKTSMFTAIAIAALMTATAASAATTAGDFSAIKCEAGGDPAKVNWIKNIKDGKVEFNISTSSQTYQGYADPKNPKHSMEKQVLALKGKKEFCLQD